MFGGLFGTDPWFEPKKFGYGAGLPCAWQGWVLLGGYLAVVAILVAFSTQMGLVVNVTSIVLVTIPFIWLVKRHTRGGWRWRMG